MERSDNGALLALRWSSRWSLGARILAVNIFALALLAGGFFYLDSFRSRELDQRLEMISNELQLIADALQKVPQEYRDDLIRQAGQTSGQRIRFYGADGRRQIDSWEGIEPSYELRDPASEPWQRHVARFLDKVIERVAGTERLHAFVEPRNDRLSSWPEAVEAQHQGKIVTEVRRAPDRTPVLSAALAMPEPSQGVLLATINARDVIRNVRAERFRLGVVLAVVIGLSVLLSSFLARTIVLPLKKLAWAAHSVRQGRSREVQVPRLPTRQDEIGLLARAVSDMSLALRQRIDATEAFAADVAHELKNPLASMRSAVDALSTVKDPELQGRLLAVVRDDVIRIDRLISDISEASRMDAELSRARFEPIDLGVMIKGIVQAREERGMDGDVRVAFARPRLDTAVIMGDGSRMARAIGNLLDNAVSFSPPGGLVQIAATRDGDSVLIRIEDEGPGVPESARAEIFNRFHSLRPDSEEFGKHSGLGLAIARAVVDGHGGQIMVQDREDGTQGACFLIRLPWKGII